MYLWKQWRESRIISGIGLLGLLLLLMLVVKANLKLDSSHVQGNDTSAFPVMFIALFYIESVLIAFWAWLAASIGVGKNLGEDSGSFLFTRPRSRAWFIWNDWGFGMAQIALIIVLSNLMLGWLLEHIQVLMHISGGVRLTPYGDSIPIPLLLLLISLGVLLFSSLVFSLTYFSTIVTKRLSGVLLGAGILIGYVVLSLLIGHYYPSIKLPSPIPNLFNFSHHSFNGLADHLGLSIAIRTVVVLLFPLAAQVILDRSEI
ncbi:MAG: hypothetical protein WA419_10860 [Silvibacterium sp.]